jgi:DNA-binding MarR family transcriptional regulator
MGPLDLSNGQFSLMMSLNRPEPPSIGRVASPLSIDRTTITTALKPLRRRGVVEVTVRPRRRAADARGSSPAGERRAHLAAYNAAIDGLLPHADLDRLRQGLRAPA